MDEWGIVEQLKKINDNLDKLVKIFTSQIIITKDTDLNFKEVSGQINTANTNKRVDINSELVGCSIDNNCVKMSDELKEKFKSLQKDIMATTTITSNFKDFEINSSPSKTIISCEGCSCFEDTNTYDTEETIENCTIKIWSNSDTGNVKIGWWKNDK